MLAANQVWAWGGAQQSKKYAIFSDNSDAFLSFAKASSEQGRVSGTTCVDSSSAFGCATKQT